MKRMLLFALAAVCCATVPALQKNAVIVIHAQSLPVTKTLLWDASSDATSYVVTQDDSDSRDQHPPTGKRLIELIACVAGWTWLSRYDDRLDRRGRLASDIGLGLLGIGLVLWCLTLIPATWGWLL